MNNLTYYIWLAILIIYIISPRDLHPSLIDDLAALGVIWYLRHKYMKQIPYGYTSSSERGSEEGPRRSPHKELTLKDAYEILGVTPDSSFEEVKKAYKKKIIKNHPDKVSHLSQELQEKARELTLNLNAAFDVVKHRRKG